VEQRESLSKKRERRQTMMLRQSMQEDLLTHVKSPVSNTAAEEATVKKNGESSKNTPYIMRRRRNSLEENQEKVEKTGLNDKYTQNLLNQFAEDMRRSIIYEERVLSKSFKVAAINVPAANK
jgi:hypothetical protein